MARLFLKRSSRLGEFIDINRTPVIVGRAETCDLKLDDPSVSRRHARITDEGGLYFIQDLGSKNGTIVNGRPADRVELKTGDAIAIGKYRLRFVLDDSVDFVSDDVNSRIQKVLPVDSEGIPAPSTRKADQTATDKSCDHLQTLYKISSTIAELSNLDEVLDKVADTIFQVIGPDECQILLRDEKSGKLRSAAIRTKEVGDGVPILTLSRTILNKVLSEQVAILTSDAQTDPRFKQAESVRMLNIRSTMCAPLKYKETTLGILHVTNHVSSGEFHEDDLSLLVGIANQAAGAIENSRLYEKVQREERIRGSLQRFLSPDLVDQVIRGEKAIDLGGVTKEITVMFADIRGFTGLAERIAPAPLIEMLNTYFTEMSDIVFDQKGAIDKFVGDAFIAVFGTPFHLEDHAARAIRAALLMQESMKGLNRDWREQGKATFEIGIGISTGTVIYGNVGSEQRMELTVIGDAVNLACRLSEVAGPGKILISGETLSSAGDTFPCEPVKIKGVKGKSKSVDIFEVAGPA
jgi:adenylate cyclase